MKNSPKPKAGRTTVQKTRSAGLRTRKYQQRRAAILASAVELINRKGVKGMTLTDITANLKLVPTGIIYYFANKEELAAACFMSAIETFDRLIAEAAGGKTVQERLRLFVLGYFEFRRAAAVGETNQIAVFNDVRALNDPAVNTAYTNMFRRARGLIDPSPARQIERRALNAQTHLLLSQLFWAVVWLPQYDPEDYGRAGQRFLDILERGIGGPTAVWSPRVPPVVHEDEASDDVAQLAFLRAATQLINEQGYRGASVEKISARLNVSKGSFYHHNEAKDDLVAACFERTLAVIAKVRHDAEKGAQNSWARICSAAAALVEYQISGDTPLLRTSALTSTPVAMQAELVQKFNRASINFASTISDGIMDGSIRPVDTNISAQMVTATINASAELGFWSEGISPQQATQDYVRPVFSGLVA